MGCVGWSGHKKVTINYMKPGQDLGRCFVPRVLALIAPLMPPVSAPAIGTGNASRDCYFIPPELSTHAGCVELCGPGAALACIRSSEESAFLTSIAEAFARDTYGADVAGGVHVLNLDDEIYTFGGAAAQGQRQRAGRHGPSRLH